MNKLKLIIINMLFLLLFQNCFAGQKEELKNDYLYSEAYFDYLIECASIDYQEEIERKKAEEKQALADSAKITKKESNKEEIYLAEDTISILDNEDNGLEPFRLRIQNIISTPKYSETFKKEDTKIIIPVSDKFSFIHNTSKSRNKYSSTDYKILAGAEITPFNFLKIAGGLETNYRDIDQNPASRKIYVTPELKIAEKVSLIFPNKYNILSGSTDHDIGVNISPFKSKSLDFGIYSGLTRSTQGKTTQSINFSTNIYLF